ncbi:Gfo/Idh/MocA family protein [Phycisphaera mikurensis]|uniref:Gfo/Idh/MocA-like oxidoreductase N-terminal domain-containing protein n=1 Tax=Phycisphaera mikurensis (strain NBRC 102666 / KCTC 22515 / FYK2301M01) TaxID=1142394 RepID=I0IGZ3_PHYMF|nr:Gfo/Idh/MocA family oxidoreductase [Phycisphaera mikurensis]MBB6440788.1 putative dehydrogenase [Phycisphaera mikurensis]BAM04531.1 hypothetical protein PSMK_23720 [Phycisphaera mikurensis NBRC 102666]
MNHTGTIRAGVVGAGVFGSHHARTLALAGGVALAGLNDEDRGRAEALAASGAAGSPRVFTRLEDLLDAVDAVVVATPAPTHAAIAAAALRRGVHTLVEKPLATTLPEADLLIGLAEENDRVLQVGHQESFVARALGLPEHGPPRRFRAIRHAVHCGRGTEVSVVMDLMIHDLHLAVMLAGVEPDEADAAEVACEVRAASEGRPDRVEACFTLGDTRCKLSASRVEARPIRRLELAYAQQKLDVDLARREVSRAVGAAAGREAARDADSSGLADPLSRGAAAFLRAIRGEGPPGVSGREGRAALRLALQVERAAEVAA